MLFQRPNVKRDSLEESAFIAFSISITTRIDKETVEADRDISFENISQPISENSVEHLWK
jgi:hypothetical protein